MNDIQQVKIEKFFKLMSFICLFLVIFLFVINACFYFNSILGTFSYNSDFAATVNDFNKKFIYPFKLISLSLAFALLFVLIICIILGVKYPFLLKKGQDKMDNIFVHLFGVAFISLIFIMTILIIYVFSGAYLFNTVKAEIMVEASKDLEEKGYYLLQDYAYEETNYMTILNSCGTKHKNPIVVKKIIDNSYSILQIDCDQHYRSETDKWDFEINEYENKHPECITEERMKDCMIEHINDNEE